MNCNKLNGHIDDGKFNRRDCALQLTIILPREFFKLVLVSTEFINTWLLETVQFDTGHLDTDLPFSVVKIKFKKKSCGKASIFKDFEAMLDSH